MRESALTKQQHLDLVPLHHLVALQLVLNLVVSGLAIPLLRAHSATHFAGVSGFRTELEKFVARIKIQWRELERGSAECD